MAQIVRDAYSRIFPEEQLPYAFELDYSGRFRDYNSIVRKSGSRLAFHLSRKWESVDREIVIGLLQVLLLRILHRKATSTLNMELYHSFVKNLDLAAQPKPADPLLQASFERVNNRYFSGMLSMPTLKWGNASFSKLASYDYHSDTVTVSSIFMGSPSFALDYLVYHELLHKKLKFSSSSARSIHHSAEFTRLESQFENSAGAERELQRIAAKSRLSRKKRLAWLPSRLF